MTLALSAPKPVIAEWPQTDCVYIRPEEQARKRGDPIKTPSIGWQVLQAGNGRTALFKGEKVKHCKKWAENQWPQIKNWKRERNIFYAELR